MKKRRFAPTFERVITMISIRIPASGARFSFMSALLATTFALAVAAATASLVFPTFAGAAEPGSATVETSVNAPLEAPGSATVDTTANATTESAEPAAGLQKGKPAPDFAFKTISGEEFKLSAQKGKVVLVIFWFQG
jgi:hypothetical protein